MLKMRRFVFAALRVAVALSLLMVALSFSSWWAGTEHLPGMADRLFGWQFAGWRGDVVFMFATCLLALLAIALALPSLRKDAGARTSAIIAVLWIVVFVGLGIHLLKSGLIYMG